MDLNAVILIMTANLTLSLRIKGAALFSSMKGVVILSVRFFCALLLYTYN